MVTCSDCIIFNAVTSTSIRTSIMVTCSDDILLKFAVVSASRNGNPRHSPGGAKTLMFFVLFCFCFCFFLSRSL